MADRATTVGLLMRNCVSLIAAGIALANRAELADAAGTLLMGGVFAWSLYRVLTRSHRWAFVALDYVAVLAVCLGVPLIIADPAFHLHNTVPQVIAGTAVISFALGLHPVVSLVLAAGVAAAYGWGSAAVIGSRQLGSVAALYYFWLQWLTGALIRYMLLRVALTVDNARAGRLAAELEKRVGDSVREFGREQVALLHDTAASTLLMVGQGGGMPPVQLAERARRDLDVLEGGVLTGTVERLELVAALHDCVNATSSTVRFAGCASLWVDGRIGTAVVSAAREAVNNAERHAAASELIFTVSDTSVTVRDNGLGFDHDAIRRGHGLSESICGRMERVGGRAQITSAPGCGTTVELCWPTTQVTHESAVTDPDRLIERVRARFGLALVGYALANLVFAVVQSLTTAVHSTSQIMLAIIAGIATLAAVPEIVRRRWRPVWWAAAALLSVAVIQPALLPTELVGGYGHWAQSVIGWCLLPLLLGLPLRRAAAALVFFWCAGAAAQLIVAPAWAAMVNIGLGSASILGVQLFALVFNALVRDAAADAYSEASAHRHVVIADRLDSALRAEYQRRFAGLMNNVLPVLRRLGDGEPMNAQLQERARAECRRLRTLFDQSLSFEHPLMAAIRPMIDACEARGVDVTVGLSGALPELTSARIDALLEPVGRALSAALDSARVIIHGCVEELSVSVVVPEASHALGGVTSRSPDIQAEIVESDSAIWVLIRCQLVVEGDGAYAG